MWNCLTLMNKGKFCDSIGIFDTIHVIIRLDKIEKYRFGALIRFQVIKLINVQCIVGNKMLTACMLFR